MEEINKESCASELFTAVQNVKVVALTVQVDRKKVEVVTGDSLVLSSEVFTLFPNKGT